jgi:hypothetical protein
MRLKHVAVLLLAFAAARAPQGAHACACCTNTGQRNVATHELDSGRLGEISQLRFAPTARLFSGITAPSSQYRLKVAQETSRWVFMFRDGADDRGRWRWLFPS